MGLSDKDAGISTLDRERNIILNKCISHKLCMNECKFLSKYGPPKDMAISLANPGREDYQKAYECSLCGLCASVCPVGANPGQMFFAMRKEAVKKGIGPLPEHGRILKYEGRGVSKRYTWRGLPRGCHTVFFPGCTLPGTRPEATYRIFEHLKKSIPNIGVVLDCCTKPSLDLGREDYFKGMFGELVSFLRDNGVKTVYVACPNCYKVFKEYSRGLDIKTVYQFMANNGFKGETARGTVTVHDPCVLRFNEDIQASVRELIEKSGLSIREMPHHGKRTLCCGEGGAVGLVSPDLAKSFGALRKKEARGNRIITYCAGCANFLDRLTPTSHVIDLILGPEETMAGKTRVSRAPMTYLNRLGLKKKFKKSVDAEISGERRFVMDEPNKKKGLAGRLLILALVIAAIVAVRLTGAHQYLEEEKLRAFIEGYGVVAPLIYMFIYAVAPSLFLPGLPLTVVGGILFGPVYGVLYTIVSATIGASLAFLISRYIARDWVSAKLTGPKWKELDEGVERQGWKIVAFTRLIPLFPFNLLNYAFGLTKIKFLHYVIASFFFMLPGCTAYIVFSSSLLDLFKGKISPTFLLGVALVVIVSLLPFFYKRHKAKKEAGERG